MDLIGFIRFVFELYTVILLVRVLLSWFQVDPYNPLVRLLYQLTEPLLAPIRRFLPSAGPFDFSPIVALILVMVVEQLVISLAAPLLR